MASLSPLSGSPGSIKNEPESVNATGSMTATTNATATTKPKNKPRKRVNTAEKRHQHNAIERARRETLNGKFLVLARLLPSLASHRRPSKSAIVNGSISHLTHQRNQRILAAKLLRHLCNERDELLNEVNEWRKASGYAPKDNASGWTDEMDEVCAVEKETFGDFSGMGGDDDGDDELDVSILNDVPALPTSNSIAPSALITPRSSTDIDPLAHAASLFNHSQPSAANVGLNNAMSWSTDFAFSHAASQQQPASAPTALPFSAFMSDNMSSSGSPTSVSNLANSAMLTPPNLSDSSNLYTHTPSPRSSTSMGGDDTTKVTTPGAVPQWTPQQLMFLQSVSQQQAQLQQHPSYQAAFSMPTASAPTGGFSHPSDSFTQSLLATMFPQQSHVQQPPSLQNMGLGNLGATEQVQQWRQHAVKSFLAQNAASRLGEQQPSLNELKNAVRTGMGLGMGMATMWGGNHDGVEGY